MMTNENTTPETQIPPTEKKNISRIEIQKSFTERSKQFFSPLVPLWQALVLFFRTGIGILLGIGILILVVIKFAWGFAFHHHGSQRGEFPPQNPKNCSHTERHQGQFFYQQSNDSQKNQRFLRIR